MYAELSVLWYSKIQVEITLVTEEAYYSMFIQVMSNVMLFISLKNKYCFYSTFIFQIRKYFTRSSKKLKVLQPLTKQKDVLTR